MASTHGEHAASVTASENASDTAAQKSTERAEEEAVTPAASSGPERSRPPEAAGPGGPSAARKALDAGAATLAQVRKLLAQAAWVVCVLAALSLVLGAALIALDANEANGAVAFVLDLAERADLGWFSRENGPFQASGENKVTKDALINWGLGAVVWLVAGRIVERIVRP